MPHPILGYFSILRTSFVSIRRDLLASHNDDAGVLDLYQSLVLHVTSDTAFPAAKTYRAVSS